MKVKNLTDDPMQLGDGRMIGVNDERDYDLEKLTTRDQQRFQRGALQVTKELAADAETTDKKPVEGINLSDGVKTNGGKTNVK